MRSGRISALPISALRIFDDASSSLLPTPTASIYGTQRGGSGVRRPSLDTMAQRGLLRVSLPTPTVRDSKGPTGKGFGGLCNALGAKAPRGLLPTPTTEGNRNRRGISAKSGDGLQTAVGGRLHPRFVEWMMGFPMDWTALPIESASARSGTPSSLNAPS